MAGTIRYISRINLSLLTSNVTKQCIFNGGRTIYTDVSLGMVDFQTAREQYADKYRSGIDAFRSKMEKIVDNEKDMVFSEDLKAIIHLTEKSPMEIDLLKKCIEKFNSQSDELRFNSFRFGPIVMRALKCLDEVELARDLFMDSRFDEFFNQQTTYTILLDLLYENGKYQDVCDVYDKILTKLGSTTYHPKMAVTIVGLACYKLNTPESFEYALKIWKDIVKRGLYPLRRYVAITAALALNQEKPHVALELAESCKYRNYISIRCIRMMALAKLDRIDDILMDFKSCMRRGQVEKNQFYRDTIALVEDAVERLGLEDTAEIRITLRELKDKGYVHDMTLGEHIQSPIETTRHQERPERQIHHGWGDGGRSDSSGGWRTSRGRSFTEFGNKFNQYGSG